MFGLLQAVTRRTTARASALATSATIARRTPTAERSVAIASAGVVARASRPLMAATAAVASLVAIRKAAIFAAETTCEQFFYFLFVRLYLGCLVSWHTNN